MENKKRFILFIIGLLIITVVTLLLIWRKPNEGNRADEAVTDPPAPSDAYDPDGLYQPTEDSFDMALEEDNSVLPSYSNRAVLDCEFPSGSVLSLGVVSGADGMLYLNPHYECIEDELVLGQDMTQFGYYIGGIDAELSFSSNDYGFADTDANINCPDLVIRNRTFDTLSPAVYTDTIDYGIGWSSCNLDGQDRQLSIRVVRFPDGHMMGIAHAAIVYDSGSNSYSLSDLHYADAYVRGEIDEPTRNELAHKAIDYITTGNTAQTFVFAADNWDLPYQTAIIEKTTRPYFAKLYDANAKVISRGSLSGCEIYAVNLNQIGAGHITVYFAPQNQLWGLTERINPVTGKLDLTVCGYDPLYPYSSDELFILPGDESQFF